MTLREAVATGKPYKRENWECFITGKGGSIYVEDAIADDWEVEKTKNEGWINIYSFLGGCISTGGIFPTHHAALLATPPEASRIATIKIEWEG